MASVAQDSQNRNIHARVGIIENALNIVERNKTSLAVGCSKTKEIS